MQTCLHVRVLNSGGAAVLGAFKPKDGGNTRKGGEGRKEETSTKKLLCARHCAKDCSLIFSFKRCNLFRD